MNYHFLFKIIVVLFLNFISLDIFSNANSCYIAPKICPNENITYWLVKRNNQEFDEVQLLTNFSENLESISFDSNVLMKVLVHGFTSNRSDDFNEEMTKELFKYGEFYIINVDWGPLAQGKSCRCEASQNVFLVAQCTAQFIENLISQTNYSLENIHLIGFSMGAQVVGLIKNYLSDNLELSHITGLDPTLPYFDEGKPQLTSQSAEFVDVIHTAIGSKSQREPRGHIDFFLNNSTYQPGCEEQDLIEGKEHICSHRRAYKYYAESINSKAAFIGEGVQNYCQKYILMGYHVPLNSSGVYHVKTKAESPYGLGMGFD